MRVFNSALPFICAFWNCSHLCSNDYNGLKVFGMLVLIGPVI